MLTVAQWMSFLVRVAKVWGTMSLLRLRQRSFLLQKASSRQCFCPPSAVIYAPSFAQATASLAAEEC